jgi:hypothetical protein
MSAVQEILHVNCKKTENCSPVICFTAEAWNLALRRLVWTGHVSHTGENKSTYRVLVGKHERRVPSARLQCRKQGNTKWILKELAERMYSAIIWLR